MKKKPVVDILALTLIVCSIFSGCGKGRNTTNTTTDASDRELSVNIHLSELDFMRNIEGPIYIAGHKSPDSDTVGSAIGYAALLRKLGFDATAVVIGDINNETKFVLQKAGLDTPELLVDASGLNMILVDHGDYEQSADGMKDANILGIIDHHGDGSVGTSGQLLYDARALGATATIVWTKYLDYGVEPDKQTAIAMLGSILSDTLGLKADTTTFADKEAAKNLAEIGGIEEIDGFYTDLYKALISLDGMTDEEIFFSDYKEYEAGGRKFSIGCINVYDEDEAKDIAARMKAATAASLKATGMDMAFAQVSIFHDDTSVAYLVPSDDIASEVLKEAFGDRATFDENSYILRPGISRRTELVPAISVVLEAFPKED
ncbi:DHH family phosphoesterase [Butyrivibrio sp. AC2005]|uniref:DHH family phosphoesterase n=1 Tax=Butyrivibrio sp. AC2005 TaxID=1280672 RepID=UPI00041C04C1|nr:DHHA2 domain-containing protein [Butyrivibrio sp. AC2005]